MVSVEVPRDFLIPVKTIEDLQKKNLFFCLPNGDLERLEVKISQAGESEPISLIFQKTGLTLRQGRSIGFNFDGLYRINPEAEEQAQTKLRQAIIDHYAAQLQSAAPEVLGDG